MSLVFYLLKSTVTISVCGVSGAPSLNINTLKRFVGASHTVNVISTVLLSIIVTFAYKAFIVCISHAVFSFHCALPFHHFKSV